MTNTAWNSIGEFLAMGGYGVYVWGSFGFCALALAFEGVMLSQRRRAALASSGASQ
jgi:heme exporter protein D